MCLLRDLKQKTLLVPQLTAVDVIDKRVDVFVVRSETVDTYSSSANGLWNKCVDVIDKQVDVFVERSETEDTYSSSAHGLRTRLVDVIDKQINVFVVKSETEDTFSSSANGLWNTGVDVIDKQVDVLWDLKQKTLSCWELTVGWWHNSQMGWCVVSSETEDIFTLGVDVIHKLMCWWNFQSG